MAEHLKLICLLALASIILCCTNNASGCQVCSGSSCSQCMNGYYLNGNTCNGCYSLCVTCSAYFTCTSCKNGDYFSTQDSWCYTCPSHCQACSSNTVCTKCNSNYFLNGTSCQSCSSTCSTCQDNIGCTSCIAGTYLQSNICQNCVSGCAICTNQLNCQSCFSEYFIQGTSCQVCSANCSVCTSSSTCTNCSSNFYMMGSSCLSCGSYCNACSNNIGCTSCLYTNMYIQNQVCSYCPTGCVYCTSQTNCSFCDNTYTLRNFMCYTICPANSYFSAGSCLSCGNYCASCVDDSGCVSCTQLAMYIEFKNCQACPDGCSSCTSSTNCTDCRQNYRFSNYTCIYVPVNLIVNNTEPVNLMTIIPIICGILVIVIIAAICKKVFFPSSLPILDLSSVTNNEKQINWVSSDSIYRYRSFVCQYPTCSQASQPKANIRISCEHLFHMPCLLDWLHEKQQTKCPVPGCLVTTIAHTFTFVCLKCKKYQATTPIANAIMMSLAERTQCANCYKG